MGLNLAQRVVLVVALGFALLALGQWVVVTSQSYPTGWTGYAPLRVGVYGPGGITPDEVLLLWIGLAAVWALASVGLLRTSRRSTRDVDRPASQDAENRT